MKKRMVKFLAVAVPLFWAVYVPAVMAAQTVAQEVYRNNKTDLFRPFGYGGDLWAVTELLIAAVGGSVASMVASALGKGDLAGQIKLVTKLGCLGVVIKEIGKAVWSAFAFFGY